MLATASGGMSADGNILLGEWSGTWNGTRNCSFCRLDEKRPGTEVSCMERFIYSERSIIGKGGMGSQGRVIRTAGLFLVTSQRSDSRAGSLRSLRDGPPSAVCSSDI